MSTELFKCIICNNIHFEKCEICQLKCNHICCWKCISDYICTNLKAKLKCPDKNCNIFINDAIIRKALPDNKIGDYERLCFPTNNHQLFHCLLPDCDNVVFYTTKEVQFECLSCSLFNCIKCNATHPFMSCTNYQTKKNAVTDLISQNQVKEMEEEEMSRARKNFEKIKLKNWTNVIQSLDSSELVLNHEAFECSICTKIVPKGEGVKLRKCFDMFCRSCLHDSVKNSENIPINCPESSCIGKLEDREIRGILTEDEYRIYNLKCNEIAKGKIENIFHCKQPDCTFYGIIEYGKYESFQCPVCRCTNCLKCNTIHKNHETCEQYQDKIHNGENPDLRSLAYIEAEIKTGSCMKCPSCGAIIKKAGGCNWIKCPQCKLELCWILKIPRWGPRGSGDTSGGCRCGINNIPCDPQCLLGCIPDY